MFDVSQEEITEGSIARTLLTLAAPLVVQNLVQVVQQVVDTFWVGRLSENAVAAIGLNFPVMALLFSAPIGIFVGTQVLVSQRVGGDDVTGARRGAFHGVLLALITGVIIAGVVILGAPNIISLLSSNPTVSALAVTYLATVMLGFPLMSMSDAIEAGFVGWGDSRAALYINVTAVVVNIGLDPFLIFGYGPFPRLEILGAGLATALGYSAGFVLAFVLVIRGREGHEYRLTPSSAEVRIDDFREVIDIGLPSAGQNVASQSVRVVIIGIVAAVGGAAGLAAYTVGARIASVAFIPANGLQQAAQSMVGQNL
ncbi:MAG: MATE family efflux transporter, partial [Halobacteria archaeon]|nr:MATE family efflux transporter [Halobacteria archaeon]